MFNRTLLVLCTTMTLTLLMGCQQSPFEIDDTWNDTTPLIAKLESYKPGRDPEGEEERPKFEEPTGELTLADALTATMLNSPALKAASWSVRIAEAEQIQAGVKLNPTVELRVSDIGVEGDNKDGEQIAYRMRLSQTIEMGDKRARRMELARLDRDLVAWDYESERLIMAMEVINRFIAVHAAQEMVEYYQVTHELNKEILEEVRRRVRAGVGNQVELKEAEVKIDSSELSLKRAYHTLRAAKLTLASSWGSNTPEFTTVAGDITQIYEAPSIEVLKGEIKNNPQVARWTTELAQRLAAIRMARADGHEDIDVGGGVEYDIDTTETTFLLEIQFPLSFHQQNKGDLLAARYSLAQARAAQRAAVMAIENQVILGYEQMMLTAEAVAIKRDKLIPLAEQLLVEARKGYENGAPGFNYSDVVGAQKDLATHRLEYVELLVEYHQGVALVESLIGKSFTEVGKPKAEEQKEAEGEASEAEDDAKPEGN